MENDALLLATLEVAIPLWVERVKTYPFEHRQELAADCAQMIASHGDNILFKSKKRGDTAAAFNALAQALAILSLQPGGVRFLGRVWSYGEEEA